jgi:hypothetical protein
MINNNYDKYVCIINLKSNYFEYSIVKRHNFHVQTNRRALYVSVYFMFAIEPKCQKSILLFDSF